MVMKNLLAIAACAGFVSLGLPYYAVGQDAPPEAPAEAAPEPASAAADEPAEPAFSQEQLDQLLAPIALYPDPLIAQLMMASTYPLEIVEADRWRDKNASLEGDALDKALESEEWDPSVKALTLFPDLLGRMSEHLDWTQDLGDAVLAQQADVLDTVQKLRKQAYDAGNLKSGEQQTVTVEGSTQNIQIEPAKTEVVYVPQYNSAAAYGTPPPANNYYPEVNTYSGTEMVMTGALAFGAGLLVGNLIWDDDSDCDWDDHYVYGHGGHNEVKINVDGDVNIGNKVNVGSGNRQPWRHDPEHRRGVKYGDTKTRQTYANASTRPTLSRDAALGNSRGTLGSGGGIGKGSSGGLARAGGAAPKLGGAAAAKAPAKALPKVAPKAATPGSRVAAAPKASSAAAAKRPATGGIGSVGGNRPTALGGLGGGSATRAASARGASSRGTPSRGSLGGGSKGGGGGGGLRRR